MVTIGKEFKNGLVYLGSLMAILVGYFATMFSFSAAAVLFSGIAQASAAPFSGIARATMDYNEFWNRPTIGHASFDFRYVYFGMVDPRHREPGIDIRTLPPVPGLKYRSCSVICPKDTCFASRAVMAVRCPEDSVLLRWASRRAALFTAWCENKDVKQGPRNVASVASASDLCNQYIRRINRAFNKQIHGECEGHDIPNEQHGYLLTDCWATDNYCTFYEAKWYDMMSCGDNTTESYFTVNRETGQELELSDIVSENDYPKLAKIMMDYLKNYKGELRAGPSFERTPTKALELLKARNGCALIREGLIIYYYPYEIGAGADGQFNAVIPYDRLKGILKTNIFSVCV